MVHRPGLKDLKVNQERRRILSLPMDTSPVMITSSEIYEKILIRLKSFRLEFLMILFYH